VRSARGGSPGTSGAIGVQSRRATTAAGSCRPGGARFYLARWLGIRIDVRERATYLGARSQGQDHGWLDTGRWFFDTELTGGVFASFGAK